MIYDSLQEKISQELIKVDFIFNFNLIEFKATHLHRPTISAHFDLAVQSIY